jgi:hypothetical protein
MFETLKERIMSCHSEQLRLIFCELPKQQELYIAIEFGHQRMIVDVRVEVIF